MRIVFDGYTLCGLDGGMGAGIEHYTRELLRALLRQKSQDKFFVLVSSNCSSKILNLLAEHAENVRFVQDPLFTIPFVGRHLYLPLRVASLRPDLYFSPFGQLPFGLFGCRSVMTVHDISIFEHPEWFADEMYSSFSTRVLVPRSFKKVDHILCVSRWTQSRLHQQFPVTKGKTSVVHEGVELGHHKEVQHTQHVPFDREYMLCLGTVEPRKNYVHAFRAFERFLSMHPDQAGQVRLIVAGKRGWKITETEEAAAAINHAWKQEDPDGVIRFIGPVTEEEKWYLLSRASGLLFLSYEEGFGLPILEAMSVGTPVIASRNGAMEEVGGDAALFVDPEDVVAASLAIAQCVLVPEGLQTVREQGYLRAKQMSWDQTASKTLEYFHQFLS